MIQRCASRVHYDSLEELSTRCALLHHLQWGTGKLHRLQSIWNTGPFIYSGRCCRISSSTPGLTHWVAGGRGMAWRGRLARRMAAGTNIRNTGETGGRAKGGSMLLANGLSAVAGAASLCLKRARAIRSACICATPKTHNHEPHDRACARRLAALPSSHYSDKIYSPLSVYILLIYASRHPWKIDV